RTAGWPSASYALLSRHQSGLLLCCSHMPSRTIRLFLLHLHLPIHRPRTLLRLIPKQRNLKHWSHPPPNPHSSRLCRIHATMRPNIILRSYRNHNITVGRDIPQCPIVPTKGLLGLGN
uniref:Uncharacterized protein n=1 Tax=Zonotrichia albicollis TaxID=44394 RepID=A0A8D2M0Q0_ZONAL